MLVAESSAGVSELHQVFQKRKQLTDKDNQ